MDYIEQEVSLNQITVSSEVFCLSLIGVIPSFYKLGEYEEEVRHVLEAGELFL